MSHLSLATCIKSLAYIALHSCVGVLKIAFCCLHFGNTDRNEKW